MGYNNGIYRLKLDNKYVLFNINGKDTGLVYDYIVRSGDNLIRLQFDGKWGVIDINDNVHAPFIYDRACNPGYKDAIGLGHNSRVNIIKIL